MKVKCSRNHSLLTFDVRNLGLSDAEANERAPMGVPLALLLCMDCLLVHLEKNHDFDPSKH